MAALRDVSLDIYAGEAHALVGENGAGKSTVVKVLAGVHAPDAGTVSLDGAPVNFAGPAEARAAGIAVIYQEPTLFPDLSVAENIYVGRQPLRAARGFDRRIDTGAMRRRSEELFARLGVHLDPDRPARGSVHCGPATGRDREGAVVSGPGARDGRADRGTVRSGG